MERCTETKSVPQDACHWFKFVNIGGSEQMMLQPVVSSECYLSVDNNILVLKTKAHGVKVTVVKAGTS